MMMRFLVILLITAGTKLGEVDSEDVGEVDSEDENEPPLTEEKECEICTDLMQRFGEGLSTLIKEAEPFNASISDCEICKITNVEKITFTEACVEPVDNCDIQTIHVMLPSVILKCNCELNTEKGKITGGIHGTIENSKFIIKIKSCRKPLGDVFLDEEGHMGADKLHIKCDVDDEYIKYCENEEKAYDIDEAVTVVGKNVAKFLQTRGKYLAGYMDCRQL